MQLREVETGHDYAWTHYTGRYYGGQPARVRVLEIVPIEIGRWHKQTIRGLKVKLIQKGYTGPQRKGEVFTTQARYLMHPWAHEVEIRQDAERREEIRQLMEFRRSVIIAHVRARLAVRGLRGGWSRHERDYSISPTKGDDGGFEFGGNQLLALLDRPGVDPGFEDPQRLPIDIHKCAIVVRAAGKGYEGKPQSRIYCNGIPITGKFPKKRTRDIYDVLVGNKFMPPEPVEEE